MQDYLTIGYFLDKYQYANIILFYKTRNWNVTQFIEMKIFKIYFNFVG